MRPAERDFVNSNFYDEVTQAAQAMPVPSQFTSLDSAETLRTGVVIVEHDETIPADLMEMFGLK